MEDKPLTESINKQYSKYGSLRVNDNRREKRIELCNSEDPVRFLTRIDSCIKDAKAKVKRTLDNSSISEDIDSSYDQMTPTKCNDNTLGTIPLVILERNRALFNKESEELYSCQSTSNADNIRDINGTTETPSTPTHTTITNSNKN